MPQEVAESALVDLLLLAETDMLVTWGGGGGHGPGAVRVRGRGARAGVLPWPQARARPG